MGDERTTFDIVDLSRAVAASCYVAAVLRETNTAHDAAVSDGVHEVDVQLTLDSGVVDDPPSVIGPGDFTNLLELRRKVVDVQVSERVANIWDGTVLELRLRWGWLLWRKWWWTVACRRRWYMRTG